VFIRDLGECEEFAGGDRTLLRELLHPDKHPVDVRYSLAHAVVKAGRASVPHRLKTSEVYYILSGRGMMNIDGGEREVRAGQALYIPPNAVQFIKNTGEEDLNFLCIVDPAWRREDEEILDE
jgi:mannose-6-phosphate isomerase-like protein (cupin superfamily)